MEYFGLWLSADYGKGYSKAKPKCTTYASPMLSSSEEFEVDRLELWGVGDPVLPDEVCIYIILCCILVAIVFMLHVLNPSVCDTRRT